jgi:hypothetical protein
MARSKKSTTKKPAKKPAKKAKPAAKKKPAAKSAKKKSAKKPATKPTKKPAAKKPAAKPAKKPAAKKPAKAAKTPAAPAAMPDAPTTEHLAKLAMAGDLDVLLGLMDGVPETDRDATAYKWLAVASDFGHEDADEILGDLQESSSLRYDDDHFVSGNAHWEIGLAYLTASDGLPRDLDKARSQLASAKESHYPMSVQESDTMQAQARARLAPDALAIFDAVYAGDSGRIDERGGEGDEGDG